MLLFYPVKKNKEVAIDESHGNRVKRFDKVFFETDQKSR
jgi:hypothetical protein